MVCQDSGEPGECQAWWPLILWADEETGQRLLLLAIALRVLTASRLFPVVRSGNHTFCYWSHLPIL